MDTTFVMRPMWKEERRLVRVWKQFHQLFLLSGTGSMCWVPFLLIPGEEPVARRICLNSPSRLVAREELRLPQNSTSVLLYFFVERESFCPEFIWCYQACKVTFTGLAAKPNFFIRVISIFCSRSSSKALSFLHSLGSNSTANRPSIPLQLLQDSQSLAAGWAMPFCWAIGSSKFF